MIIALIAGGCTSNERPTRPQSRTQTTVQAKSFLLNADQFDLQTIVGLIKDNKVENVQALEELINGNLEKLDSFKTHFLPTAKFQEVSLSNGWGDELIKLADLNKIGDFLLRCDEH